MTAPLAVDRLVKRIDDIGSGLCVGLDPVLDRLPSEVASLPPAEAFERFGAGVIDAVLDHAAAIKFQSACYERLGPEGLLAMERTIARAREAGLFVVLDAKRGDIGISARHYAAAAARAGADAITASPYLGSSTLTPYRDAGLLTFVLVRTSNADSDHVQAEPLASGATLAEHVGSMVASLGTEATGGSGLSEFGAVVGATKSSEGERLRGAMPDQVFLVPGLGAQGGTAEDLKPLVRPGATSLGRSGVLATASRSVIYAHESGGAEWQAAVGEQARRTAGQLRGALG